MDPRFDLVTGPASEPVTLAELKAHAKIEFAEDDADLNAYIAAARQRVETYLGRALITQEWTATLPAWPTVNEGERHRRVRLAHFPVQSIESVSVDGSALASSYYRLDGKFLLVATSANDSEGDIDDAGCVIAFTAGYGDDADDTPAPILLAIKMLATHYYEARGATSPQGIYHQLIPEGVAALLQPYTVIEI